MYTAYIDIVVIVFRWNGCVANCDYVFHFF